VVLVEILLIIRREPSCISWVRALIRPIGISSRASRRSYLVKGHVQWDVVTRHDLLHVVRTAGDIILIVLARGIHPFLVIAVELALVARRQNTVPTLGLPVCAVLRWGQRDRGQAKRNQQR